MDPRFRGGIMEKITGLSLPMTPLVEAKRIDTDP
jgi:hypothetical protein